MRIREQDFTKLLVRPVVVITTISKNGVPNAAPFSFNSPISFEPPLYGFASSPEHDTWRNVRETGEFVANVVGEDFGELMHILETDFPYEVSEIEKAGLTAMPSACVKPPRIREALAWIECKLEASYELGDHVWVVGRVVCAEVKDEFWDAVLDAERAKPLCHISGEFFACDARRRRFKRAR